MSYPIFAATPEGGRGSGFQVDREQCLEVRAEMGMPLTVLTRQVEVIV